MQDAEYPSDATPDAQHTEEMIVSAPAGAAEPAALRSLHPAIRRIWWMAELLEAVILAGILAAAEHFWLHAYLPAFVPVGTLAVLGAALLLAHAMVWPALRYRHWRFAIRGHDVLVLYGVIWKLRRCVPRNRIQHVDIEAGPIDRAFGLVKLSLFTAGTISAVATIPGLTPDEAEQLREQLLSTGPGHV